MNPLHAAYYADRAVQQTVPVHENVPLARDIYRLRFECPEMARRIVPGQFLMLRLAGYNDPLLGRPLALYDTALDETGQPTAIDVVYRVGGKLTGRLAQFQLGQQVEVWGPLGNGFAPLPAEHLIMVAGGIGQTPFVALAQEVLGIRTYGDPPRRVPQASHVTFCYGVQTAAMLAGVEDFQRAGVTVRVATEDGSQGHPGRVTEVLQQVLAEVRQDTRIVCCGPEPMMRKVARIAGTKGVPCQVSLETPMACGIGICYTCVAKVRDAGGDWDYRRTCVEGPVFDARDIVW